MKSGRAICFAGDLLPVAGCVTGFVCLPIIIFSLFFRSFFLYFFPDTHLVVFLLLPSVWSYVLWRRKCLFVFEVIHPCFYRIRTMSCFAFLCTVCNRFPPGQVHSIPTWCWVVCPTRKKKKGIVFGQLYGWITTLLPYFINKHPFFALIVVPFCSPGS